MATLVDMLTTWPRFAGLAILTLMLFVLGWRCGESTVNAFGVYLHGLRLFRGDQEGHVYMSVVSLTITKTHGLEYPID